MLDFPVRETVLDNGLKVLTVEHRVAPITTVWVWYRVGSRNERPGITGISHWVEHMCFKGGIEFGKGDIFKEVARVGGYNNGMTSTDFTVYFETVPSAHGDLGLRIEADRMANARFDPDEAAAERTVIISEREGAENWPTFLLGEETALAAYRTHPYRWSVIGWKADLQQITHADLWDYYKACYAPDNAVLIAVGDFETEAMLAEIRRLYGGIEGRARVPEIRSHEPPQQGERRFYLRRPAPAAYLDMAFHIPEARHPDGPALQVLTSILAGTGAVSWLSPAAGGWKTSRLYRALIETTLASAAGCNLTPGQIDPGLGHFTATVRVGVEPEAVEEAVLAVIAQATAAPPSEDEMSRAKTQLAAAVAYAGESATGIASLLGQAEMVDTYRRLPEMHDRLQAVTAEDVLRVAQTYLTPENRTTGWLIPTGEPGGAPPDSTPGNFRVFRYTGLEILRQAERRRLENGLQVVACRLDATPSVSLAGAIRGGSVLDSAEQAGRARFTAAMLERGTETRTYQELSAALDGIGATFGVGAALECLTMGGNALARDLGTLLDIAADQLRRPVFPETEMERVRTEILTQLREREDDTRTVAQKRARQLLYPSGHPYGVWEAGETPTIEALSREDLVAYHQQAVRPDETVLVLAGDIDPLEAIGQVGERFGDWEASGAVCWPGLSAAPPPEIEVEDVLLAGKTQCDIVIASPGVPRTHEDYLPLRFATMVLGQLGFMGRFGATVRDQLGLAYYCFATTQESYGDSMWLAQAGVNPRNVQLAYDTMLAQMRLMQTELISDQEYADLVANQLGALAMLLETKAKIASVLLQIERFGLGVDYYERYPDLVWSVTPEHILQAAQQYFRPEAHVRVVAGPSWH